MCERFYTLSRHFACGLNQPEAFDVFMAEGASAVIDNGDHGGALFIEADGRAEDRDRQMMVGATGIEPVTPPV